LPSHDSAYLLAHNCKIFRDSVSFTCFYFCLWSNLLIPITIIVVKFEIWFSILVYCPSFDPESYLSGITLTPCFKVVLTVTFFGYVIRYETLNSSCITWLSSNTKLCLKASMILLLWLSYLSLCFWLSFKSKYLNH